MKRREYMRHLMDIAEALGHAIAGDRMADPAELADWLYDIQHKADELLCQVHTDHLDNG